MFNKNARESLIENLRFNETDSRPQQHHDNSSHRLQKEPSDFSAEIQAIPTLIQQPINEELSQKEPADTDFIDNNNCTAQEIEKGDKTARLGRWTRSEHIRFIQALTLYGRDWRKVQLYVKTRTSTQARSHAQKFIVKIKKKGSDLQSFLRSIDFNNLENLTAG